MSKNDPLDDLLALGGGWDWITPAIDLLAGYNTIEYEGLDDDCKKVAKTLKAQGIKCRVMFTGEWWRVISKR